MSAGMMPLTNDAGDGMVLTFDAKGPDFSVARNHHFIAETNSTKWTDQTNDVYLEPDSPLEEESFDCTDTAIIHAHSYPNETYSSLISHLSCSLHPTSMSQNLIHRQSSRRIHIHHTRDHIQRIWTNFRSPRLELQIRFFLDCFLSVP
jgi:hypothetical protein